MSIQEALRFFSAIEGDREIRQAVEALTDNSRLADLEAIARGHGYTFTVDDLREAFARDAGLKKAFYSSSNQE